MVLKKQDKNENKKACAYVKVLAHTDNKNSSTVFIHCCMWPGAHNFFLFYTICDIISFLFCHLPPSHHLSIRFPSSYFTHLRVCGAIQFIFIDISAAISVAAAVIIVAIIISIPFPCVFALRLQYAVWTSIP